MDVGTVAGGWPGETTVTWFARAGASLTGGRHADDGYSPEVFDLGHDGRRRYRTWLLAAGLAGAAVTLPAVAASVAVQWPAVAVCAAVASGLAVLSARPGRAEPFLTEVGPLVVAGVIFLLVMATGGASSPYEVLYVPLAGFAAAFEQRRVFRTVLVVSVLAALAPSLLVPAADLLVVEVLISGAATLTLVVVHRVASGLRDANQLYLSVLEGHVGPTYLLAPDGTLQWTNEPCRAVLGMSQEQVVGLSWPKVVAEGEPERLMPAFVAALEGKSQGITVRTDAPGGSYQLRGTIFPVNRYGRNVAVMGITHDVTELHAAAFGADALRRALNCLHVPVAIFDGATHGLLYANEAATQLTDVERDEPRAEVTWDRLQPQLVEQLPQPGKRRQVTIDNGGHDPRQFDVSIECLDGDEQLVVLTAVDATERGRRERELQRIAELERATVQRLRDVDRLKNAFLTAVSHELRTPSTVILGAATALQRLRDGTDPETRTKLEDALVRHADRLAHLLDDLLDLRRLTEGTSRTQSDPFDVVQLAHDIVDRDPEHDLITIDAPLRLEVAADRVQIERIIENLLGNAGKYAPGAPVTIMMRARKDGGFRLTVTDQGPGIPEEDLQRVFEPFYRVQLDHPQPGTGVGLALVAEFAAIHGGQARAERVGREGGTRIVVDVPERRAEPAVTNQ